MSHDGGPTFGFRVEARGSKRTRPVSLGYLADTGTWSEATADALADVDALGVEFNHDVDLQRGSGRAPFLIARNLGPRGHLSNAQGAGLVAAVLGRSSPGSLRHLVLLHLSEQCNRPDLAIGEARGAVRAAGRRIAIHAAGHARAYPNLTVLPGPRRKVAAEIASFPWEGDGAGPAGSTIDPG